MLPLPRGAVLPLLLLLCGLFYIHGVRSEGRVVCYYTNWSVYRPGTAKYNPQNINPYLCTHLIYAFGGFTKDNQMKPFDKYQDIEQGGYAKFTGLKTYNKQLKTMIAIGGWNEASTRFSPLVANPERRQKFIKNILKFLRQNHFDGIDLDWEYPAHREGGRPQDRENYAQFVQELRAEFEREAEKTGRTRLLLTMAVPAGIEYIEKGYDIPKLNKYLDWFNLLTYDFHASTEPSVNHHAPLYSLEEESEYNYDAELNIDYSVKFYLNQGADRDKLVLGIPTYGRSYTLINEESTEIGAPAEGPGEQGDATREKGYLAYYEICQNLKEDPEWTVVQPNANAMGPYAYRRNQWVGYDDEAIVRKKSQYVVDNGLGGIMFWAIDNDDFRGTCSGKPYPLIEAAKEAMLDALGLGINEVSKPSAPQKPSRGRSRENTSSSRNRITTTEHKLTYAERKQAGKRPGSQAQAPRNRVTTAKPEPVPQEFHLTEVEGSSLYVGGRTTTPPPPTTPDPGTDFKCEEEGFFQHPRDCKKYYWCLDSGPSGLGIVAHMFTCPSGLYFNPAADSCDFARNVPCKTKKTTVSAAVSTTSTTTTTTARPAVPLNRIASATARTSLFRTTSTTTTSEAPEYEDEEEEVVEHHRPSPFAKPKQSEKDSEEDPQVIKELIELIRKLGGVEELEKHLLRKDDGSISIKESSTATRQGSQGSTTSPTISKSLYDKVLSKPNALNSIRNSFRTTSSFRTTTQTKASSSVDNANEEVGSDTTDTKNSGNSRYSSVVRGGNSRQAPQQEGLDKLTEFDGFQKEKKQYTTIQRNRGRVSTTEETHEEDEDADEHLSQDENNEEIIAVVRTTRKPVASATPSYTSIRRTRPSATTASTLEDEAEEEEEDRKQSAEKKQYSTLNRSRTRVTTTTTTITEADNPETSAGSTRYKYIERSRSSRPTTTESSHDQDEEEEDEQEDLENTLRYPATVSINGLTLARRPVLSVRKRLINSPLSATTTSGSDANTTPQSPATAYSPTVTATAAGNTETATAPYAVTTLQQQLAQSSVGAPAGVLTTTTTTTSKFTRLRSPQRPFFNSPVLATTTTTTAPATALTTFARAGNKFIKAQRAAEGDSKVTSAPTAAAATTVSLSDNDIGGKQNTKYPTSAAAFRRKYQSRRLTTTAPANGNGDEAGTEPPRTPNPLFKRRFSLTTLSPLSAKTLLPSRPATTVRPLAEADTTIPPDFEHEEATDQVAKSSIHTSRFNQINGSPHLDDEDDEVAVGVVRHAVKPVQATTSTRQPPPPPPPPKQPAQAYQQTNYNLEDVITRRMDGRVKVASPPRTTSTTTTTTTTPRPTKKKRKLIAKQRPQTATPTSVVAGGQRRAHKYQESPNRPNSFPSKVGVKPTQEPGRTYRPNIDYDYYDDDESRLVGNRKNQQLKVILHGGGLIECLDQGNFPHPLSCRKFISCAKFETGGVVGWEYTCPKGLSYDPVGGMCNWAAGLGCKE